MGLSTLETDQAMTDRSRHYRHRTADASAGAADARSAHVLRLHALTQKLAQAETAVLTGNDGRAADMLRDLQALCAELAGRLETEAKGGPSLVAA
jgi:hypothetical protein